MTFLVLMCCANALGSGDLPPCADAGAATAAPATRTRDEASATRDRRAAIGESPHAVGRFVAPGAGPLPARPTTSAQIATGREGSGVSLLQRAGGRGGRTRPPRPPSPHRAVVTTATVPGARRPRGGRRT